MYWHQASGIRHRACPGIHSGLVIPAKAGVLRFAYYTDMDTGFRQYDAKREFYTFTDWNVGMKSLSGLRFAKHLTELDFFQAEVC